MAKLSIFLCLCICAVLALPHEKIAKIFSDIDYNENDIISQNEVLSYFDVFKSAPHDEQIAKAKFVKVWTQKYHDTTAMAELIYSKFDANGDGLLTNSDIPVFFAKIDHNHNGLEWEEFQKTFNEWYSEI